MNARRAVGFAAVLVNLSNLLGQPLILKGARCGGSPRCSDSRLGSRGHWTFTPGVVSTPGHLEDFAHQCDREVSLLYMD
jgi:hypothetical protein